jgi:hypothetical protein
MLAAIANSTVRGWDDMAAFRVKGPKPEAEWRNQRHSYGK